MTYSGNFMANTVISLTNPDWVHRANGRLGQRNFKINGGEFKISELRQL